MSWLILDEKDTGKRQQPKNPACRGDSPEKWIEVLEILKLTLKGANELTQIISDPKRCVHLTKSSYF